MYAEELDVDAAILGEVSSPAETFATIEHVPHALRLALGSENMEELEGALSTVKRVIENYAY